MESMFNLAVMLSAIDRASGPIKQVRQSLGTLAEQADAVQRVGESMTIAGALTQGAADQMTGALGNLIQPAIDFESKMADVKKVVDFEKPAQFASMGEDIRELSTEIPVAAGGLADIVAAAGQSGVARENLTAFAEDAAKMATAFDMTAAEAGQAMADIRAGIKISQPEMVGLGDAANFLSNNMNAAAGDIVTMMKRQGAVAKSAGLAAGETAALSAALLNSGQPAEVAATAMKNLTGTLSGGEEARTKTKEGLEELGFDVQNLAQLMQKDAQGAITSIFQALSELPEAAQGAKVKKIFGEESRGAITPLLTNLDALEKAFGLVGDQAQYAGSMEAEYEEKKDATANAIKLFNHQLDDLRITLGSFVLPAMNDALPVLQDIVEGMKGFAEANPLIFRTAMILGSLLAAILAVVAPILTVTGGLTLMGSQGMKGLRHLRDGFKWLRPRALNAIQDVTRFTARIVLMTSRVTGAGSAFTSLAMQISLFRQSLAGTPGLLGKTRVALTAFGGALRAVGMAMLSTPIGWIVGAIALVGGAIYKWWEPLTNWLSGFWQGLSSAFQGVSKTLAGVGSALGSLGPFLEGVTIPARWLWQAISGIGSAIGWVIGQIGSLLSPVDQTKQEAAATADAGAAMGRVIGSVLVSAIRVVTAPLRFLIRLFGWIADAATSGRAMLTTFADGVAAAASAPYEAVTSALGWVRDLLPFSDARTGPLSDLTTSGRQLLLTIAQGIASVATAPVRVMSSVAGSILGAFDLDLAGIARSAVDAVASTVGRIAGAPVTAAAGLAADVAGAFDPALAPAARSAVQSVTSTIRSLASDPVGAVTDLAGRIAGAFDVDLVGAGKAAMDTVAEGVRAAASAPARAAESALDGVRELLPFSDARAGPLSDLTRSGQRLAQTIGQGVAAAGSAPIARPLSAAFAGAMATAASASPPALAAPEVTPPEPPPAVQPIHQRVDPATPPTPEAAVQPVRRQVIPAVPPAPPPAVQQVEQQVAAASPPAPPDAIQQVRAAVPRIDPPTPPPIVQRVRRLVEDAPAPALPELRQTVRPAAAALPTAATAAASAPTPPAPAAATTPAPAPRIAPLPSPSPAAAESPRGAPSDGGGDVHVTVNLTVEGGQPDGDLAERLDALLRERAEDIADLVDRQGRRRRRRGFEDDRG